MYGFHRQTFQKAQLGERPSRIKASSGPSEKLPIAYAASPAAQP
jgi:hypothetical protein